MFGPLGIGDAIRGDPMAWAIVALWAVTELARWASWAGVLLLTVVAVTAAMRKTSEEPT